MRQTVFTSEFSIYKMNQANNLYIAIPNAFARIIRQYVMEYKELTSVPADKIVKGIVLQDRDYDYTMKQEFLHTTDIPINQLRFDS